MRDDKKWLKTAFAIVMAGAILAGCGSSVNEDKANSKLESRVENKVQDKIDEQPSSVFYEIFVRSFYDSDGDGTGDLQGVTEKLDYLDDLGVEGLWLMPINPSPSYHGYDVTDYYAVHPDYGTLNDLKTLVSEAHKRGIKVIMDLVVNHTSTRHPWFVESAGSVDSGTRDWYVWAGDSGANTAENSATGGKAWHAKNGDHYLGVFWEGMPDLNFDNPEVRKEMIKVGKYWLELGIDGFRLDAAKHIYEDFASSRNNKSIVDKNLAWWKEFRQGLNEGGKTPYLVGEIYEDSSAVVAPYLKEGFDSVFNFGQAGQLIAAAKSGNSANITVLSRVQAMYSNVSEGRFVDAAFLSNHDQNRVMSQLGEDTNKARMAASLLLTMPGNPFIYYGEEIGMTGVKPDERIREPMVWATVEEQIQDSASLFNHYRAMIHLRNQTAALRNGTIEPYSSGMKEVMAYVRRTESARALILHNLSAESKMVELTRDANGEDFANFVYSSSGGIELNGAKILIPAFTTIVME